MKRTLELGKETIEYELTRKRVKNINIRVRADGTIGVSSPYGITNRQVEAVLLDRADFILGALEKFSALDARSSGERQYAQGERIWYLGKPYSVRLEKGPENHGTLRDGTLCLTLRDPEKESLRKQVAEDFYRRQCLTVTAELCRKFQPRMAHLGVPLPEIKVRSMTSRWGSCKPGDQRITFAWQLMEAPLECVEYVVWHELSHFVHLNHSRDFYACLSSFLPDWQSRRRMLNSHSYR